MTVPTAFSAEAFRRRAKDALLVSPPRMAASVDEHAGPSDFALNPDHDRRELFGPAGRAREAAVLVAIRAGAGEATVILTRRNAAMRTHAGQIAFPGGRVEANDDGPAGTALREAEEEIGLDPGDVDVLGFLDCYLTGTGYHVSPVVGLVRPGFTPRPDAREVDAVFDVPLAFLMDPANHLTHARDIAGRERRFLAMPFGEHYIWGATAGMLKNLYDRVYR
jgi:8-oxo-dGTP pyrophosphatase MutT (NUDIX family)